MDLNQDAGDDSKPTVGYFEWEYGRRDDDETSSSDDIQAEYVFVDLEDDDLKNVKNTESIISILAGKTACKYMKVVKDYPVVAEMLTQLGDELGFPGSAYIDMAKLFTRLYELARKPKNEAWDVIYATVTTIGAAVLGFTIVCLIQGNFTFIAMLGYLYNRGLKISSLMAGPKGEVDPEAIREEVERLVNRAVAERAGRTTAFAGGLTDQQILELFERYRVLKRKRDKRAGAAPVSSDDGDAFGGGDVESQSGGSTSKSSKPLGQVFWLDSHEDSGISLLPGFTFSTTEEFWWLFLDRELSGSNNDSDGNRRAEPNENSTPAGDEGKLTPVAIPELQVQDHMRELKERFAGRKVMLGVDRHDITGIPQKLLAFEQFLKENPDWRDKVVLLQIAVQTRTNLPDYEKLTGQVHEIIGRINGRFGTITAVPIHYLERSHDIHEMSELYAVTDVALFTSLRDGTNLASYEFVACQVFKKGVLILSKFADAAQSLCAGAILVDPSNITEVAASIGDALNMPDNERKKRHQDNFMHVTTPTSQEWAATFVSELNDTIVKAQLRTRQSVDRYFQSDHQLLILGFNATLTEPKGTRGRRRGRIRKMKLKLHPDLKDLLKRLCNESKTTVVALNGGALDHNFGDYNMWLAAENGMLFRRTAGEWMTAMADNLNMDRVDIIKLVFEYLTEKTPLAHFKCRETSLEWNYKDAGVVFTRLPVKDLPQHLWTGPLSNASVNVVQGGQSGFTKGAASKQNLGTIGHNKGTKAPIDYALCIGYFLPKEPAEGEEREAIPPDYEEGEWEAIPPDFEEGGER